MIKVYSLFILISFLSGVWPVTITDIQDRRFLSPFNGQHVQNLTGVVTAKGPSGFWLVGEPTSDTRVSNGLMVFSSTASVLAQVQVGDKISLSGLVSEFRSSTAPDDLHLTELESPTNITVLSSNNTVTPVILGKDRSPPTQQFSALDNGADGFLSVPNNVSRIEDVNDLLRPDAFGIDFWESLEGQLVTIPNPISTAFPNSFGEFWVYGDWQVTGQNSRGGLTINFGPDGIPDGNPETVIIGAPLDKTKNPQVAVGFALSDITGVVTYQFGFYYVLPLTAPTIISKPSPVVPPTTLTSNITNTCLITFGDYNVDNMGPTPASHISAVASHIVDHLLTPDIMFLQEIQDNSGETDDGTVSANLTLSNLVAAIAKLSSVTYAFTSIDPINDQDGGVPGGNIRQAYLYRPEKLSLVPGSPAGGSLDPVELVSNGTSGKPHLNFNPGRLDPTNVAWDASRKPLVAEWETGCGSFFTINVHLTSKDGGSSTQGNSRPPVNLPVQQRTSQVQLIANFTRSLLLKDPLANIILAGDFNEFVQTRSVYAALTAVLVDVDLLANIPPLERYTYVFDQDTEQLDHAFVSLGVRLRQVEFEHIHVNNWGPLLSARVSDHDPSIGRIRIC